MALVLSRRHNETILIGDDIKITIQMPNGVGQVKVVIEAPKHVKVLRANIAKEGYEPTWRSNKPIPPYDK